MQIKLFLIVLILYISIKSNGQQNQMLNFNASVVNIDGVPQVQLTWQAVEYCTCYFRAERDSNANNNFMVFNTISGVGTSSIPHNYLSTDYGPFSYEPVTYCYRVRLDTMDIFATCYFHSYTDTVCVTVVGVVDSCFYLPNAFSPNGDGKNDFFFVNCNCFKTIHLIIFNRWGENVFETTNPAFHWDGSYQGKPMNIQVLVYSLSAELFDGKSIYRKGTISLIK